MIVIFGMVVLSFMWLAEVEKRMRKGTVLLVLPAAAAFAENLVPATPMGHVPRVPAVLERLKKESSPDDVFVMLPIFPDNSRKTKRSMGEIVKNMHRAFAADRLFITGYSGQGSKIQTVLASATKDLTEKKSFENVSNAGLSFLEKDSLGITCCEWTGISISRTA